MYTVKEQLCDVSRIVNKLNTISRQLFEAVFFFQEYVLFYLKNWVVLGPGSVQLNSRIHSRPPVLGTIRRQDSVQHENFHLA